MGLFGKGSNLFMTGIPSRGESPIPDAGEGSPGIYRAGTLIYTKSTLALLFCWILWGDFCFTFMETVTPSIMPLKLQDLKASNFEMGMILGTVPGIISVFLNPVISFKSDRYRSRWGRRIPFILGSLPFLVLSIVGLAFSGPIGNWVQHHVHVPGSWLSPQLLALSSIGILLIGFTFFNSFVTSIFYYLFNDVVPEQLLSRFMAWFRCIASLSSAIYSFFIFQYAGTHSTEILLGAALVYFFGFGLMCIKVKEGDYPPPPPLIHGKSGPLASIQTYSRDCHSHSHYWYQWIWTFLGSVGGGVNIFGLFYSLAIGLNLKQIGEINGSSSLANMVCVFFAGWLADRYHPIRIVIVGNILGWLVLTPCSMIWLFWHPSSETVFWIRLVQTVLLAAPIGAMCAMADPPLLMRIFPRDRYGQFCSTNFLWRTIGGIIGGSIAGIFLDMVTGWVGKERAYLYIPVWHFVFGLPCLICVILLYRSWKKYGGDEAYVPPIPDYGIGPHF